MNNFVKKIFSLLKTNQKTTAFFLFFLMLFGMMLETLGIGLIIPAFSVLTDPSFFEKHILTSTILLKILPNSWYADSSQLIFSQELMIALVVAIFLFVYIFKTCFFIYLAWTQQNFLKDVGLSWSERLFSGYLFLPYSFHLKNNSSHLYNNVTLSLSLADGVEACLLLVTEFLIIFGISLLLFAIEPLGAAGVIFVIIISSYYYYSSTKKHLSKWGEKRHFFDGQKLLHAHQTFNAVKDLKILGREKNFLAQWSLYNRSSAQLTRNTQVLNVLPRLWLELVAVIGFSILLFVMMAQDKSVSNIIPVLGVFAAAAFRIMPSTNRILGGLNRLRSVLPLVNFIHEELTKKIKTQNHHNGNVKDNLIFKKVIEIDKIYYTYESRPGQILSNININIPLGSQVGFVGESGSGKTTLVDIILGLLSPTKGHIKIDGVDIQKNLRGWQEQIGYVPQSVYLTDDTLRKNVAFGVDDDKIIEENVKKAIESANLGKFVANLPDGLNTLVGEKGVRLSGGQCQRIGIARALYHKPKVLVLDEATSSLDTGTEKEIMKEVSDLRGNKTVIIVTHRVSTVSNCDQLFKLDGGKIVKRGSFDEVVNFK